MGLFKRKHIFQFCVSSSGVGPRRLCMCMLVCALVCARGCSCLHVGAHVCTWARALSSLRWNVVVITAVLLRRISSSSVAKMGAGNLQRSQERASFILRLSLTMTFFGFFYWIPWM